MTEADPLAVGATVASVRKRLTLEEPGKRQGADDSVLDVGNVHGDVMGRGERWGERNVRWDCGSVYRPLVLNGLQAPSMAGSACMAPSTTSLWFTCVVLAARQSKLSKLPFGWPFPLDGTSE